MSEGRGGEMKYIIRNSDIFINNKLHPEGSEIELTEVQTKGIESFLIPLTEQSHSALVAESISVSEEKEIKSKTKGNKK